MVTHDDVRAMAALARLSISDDRLDALAAELNGILAHMDALAGVDAAGDGRGVDAQAAMPLAEDRGPPVVLEHARESFAPAMRDGFFLVPRLDTHEES